MNTLTHFDYPPKGLTPEEVIAMASDRLPRVLALRVEVTSPVIACQFKPLPFASSREDRLARSAWSRQRDDSDREIFGRHRRFRPGGSLINKHDPIEIRRLKIRQYEDMQLDAR